MKLRLIILSTVLLAMIAVGGLVAIADEHKATAAEPAKKEMTVQQVLGVWAVLTDKSFADFKFSGSVRMALARNIDVASGVQKNCNDRVTENRINIVGPGKDVPKDKLDTFNTENQKMLEAPAFVALAHIKLSDLCLDAVPPSCPSKNEIPPSMLAALLPIIDQ
jgi:hypothetical protein